MTDTRSEGPRRRADWAAIRERAEALGRDIADGARLSPEETAAVLAARARALAAPPSTETRRETEFVVFEIGEEAYAIETRFVMEILPRAEVAWIPGAEPPVLGIAAWRGELLVLHDTRRRLGLQGGPMEGGTPVLVLGDDHEAFGFPVDSVRGLREIAPSEILPLPDEVASRGAHLAGITSDAVSVLAAADLLRTQTGRE